MTEECVWCKKDREVEFLFNFHRNERTFNVYQCYACDGVFWRVLK